MYPHTLYYRLVSPVSDPYITGIILFFCGLFSSPCLCRPAMVMHEVVICSFSCCLVSTVLINHNFSPLCDKWTFEGFHFCCFRNSSVLNIHFHYSCCTWARLSQAGSGISGVRDILIFSFSEQCTNLHSASSVSEFLLLHFLTNIWFCQIPSF